MKIKDIAAVIEKVVSLKLAQDWDNVGLLLGDPQNDVKRLLLTIDITKQVLAEAAKQKAELIIAYHPVIWDGLRKITADGPAGIVFELIRHNIAVYSIHTALDSAVGGVNDGLAEIVGICDAKPIGDYVENPAGHNYKLVVYVPVDSVAKVSHAIFSAGAGWIGNYSNCSFQAFGTGTFLPLQGARPAVGSKGRLEKVGEIRFETIVPVDKLDAVVAAMKKAHPYEEPAFDVFKLHNSTGKFGLGRIGRLTQPVFVKQIINRIKRSTGAKAVGLIGNEERLVKTAAVCAGTCGKIINSVIAEKADLYVTGELKHHQALAAQEAGLTCICLSHTVSERFILTKFAKQLQEQLNRVRPTSGGQVTIKISKKDADPFTWKNI
jgi:dinuclear metal center YbgI/SA1388 family protein